MKIKCVKCKKDEELSQDEIKQLAATVKTYTTDISPNDYTAVLSVIKGKCSDGKKHIYVFHEDFDKTISDLTANRNTTTTQYDELSKQREENINKTADLRKQLEELMNKTIVIDQQTLDIVATMQLQEEELEKLTGTRDFKMWS